MDLGQKDELITWEYAVQMWRTKKTVHGRVLNKRHRNEATMNAGLKYKCAWSGMP